MSERKYCPLRSIASDNPVLCQGELCAWYAPPVYSYSGRSISEGRCAVQVLSALPAVAEAVKRL